MAKGIIKDIPTETSGMVTIVVTDPGFNHVSRGTKLKYLSSPEDRLVLNDAIEVALGPDEWCGFIRKLESPKGIITKPASDNTGGEVKVTVADPNDFGVRADKVIPFKFLGSENIPANRIGDTIQIIIDGGESSTFVKVL
jgi:hypothetical protein